MPFIFAPVVAVDPDGKTFTLVEPAHYIGRDDDWQIPAGFGTDFASIPTLVSWLIPKLGPYTRAALLHDAFCQALAGQLDLSAAPSARDTDAIFRRVMREDGVPVVTRWLVWAGVRWGALTNRHRRAGWHHDALAVLAISLAVLPIVLPATVLAALGAALVGLANLLSLSLPLSSTTDH